MYFVIKQPQFRIIDNLVRKSMMINIRVNKQSKAKDNLNTTDYPIHPNLYDIIYYYLSDEPQLPGQYIQFSKYLIKYFHPFIQKNMKIDGTTNTITKKKQNIFVTFSGPNQRLKPSIHY